MLRAKNILLVVLVAANVLTAQLLLSSRSKLADARDELVNAKTGWAMTRAEQDFKLGILRHYEVQTFSGKSPLPPLDFKPTGRTNGPFQVWFWPRYTDENDERFRLRLASESVHFYNDRMTVLYQISQGQRPTLHTTNFP